MIPIADRVVITTDNRSRVCVPGIKPHQRFHVHEHRDGSITLTPVQRDESDAEE